MVTNEYDTITMPDSVNTDSGINPAAIVADVSKMTEPKYRKSMVDLSIDVPEPVPVLKQGDKVIFTRGNVSVIGGKAKSFKTFTTVLFASEFLHVESDSVLIVDCEMHISHTYKTARRIHKLMGWDTDRNNERLTVLSLREYSRNERMEIFREAIRHLNPRLVFLDGIGDIVTDFNNIEESAKAVDLLMKLSSEYDCHICCILHVNKCNGQLHGHLGSKIVEKSETVLSVIRDGDVSTVEPSYTRNIAPDAFTFRINENGLPECCDAPVKSAKADKMREVFNEIINEETISYSNLKKAIMATGLIERTAERRIKSAMEEGIIVKNECGDYYVKKSVSEPELPF